MKGLLLKDFYCLKENMKSLFFVLLIWCFVFLPQNDGGLLLIYLCMMISAMYVFTLSSYDKHAQWDTYALSMPLTRSGMVLEKYIVTLLMLVLSAIISAVTVGTAWLIRHGSLSGEILPAMTGTLTLGAAMSLVYTSIALTTSLWLGAEKARYIPSVLFAAVFFTGFFIAKSGKLKNITLGSLSEFSILALCLSLLVFAVSYFISRFIYNRKDF